MRVRSHEGVRMRKPIWTKHEQKMFLARVRMLLGDAGARHATDFGILRFSGACADKDLLQVYSAFETPARLKDLPDVDACHKRVGLGSANTFSGKFNFLFTPGRTVAEDIAYLLRALQSIGMIIY